MTGRRSKGLFSILTRCKTRINRCPSFKIQKMILSTSISVKKTKGLTLISCNYPPLHVYINMWLTYCNIVIYLRRQCKSLAVSQKDNLLKSQPKSCAKTLKETVLKNEHPKKYFLSQKYYQREKRQKRKFINTKEVQQR